MDEILDRLPPAYAAFLRLERAGVALDVIAEQLAVAPEALPLLAELAHAKLAQAQDVSTTPHGAGDDPT